MSSTAPQMQLPPSPSGNPPVPAVIADEVQLVRLAREVAMDIKPLQAIIAAFGLNPAQFEEIRQNAHFNRILTSELEAWGSAKNTSERVRLKSASMIEEFLPEVYHRLNDRSEGLNHKVELLKTVVNLSQLGGRMNGDGNNDPSRQVTVTINLGADQQLNFKQALSTATIDVTANPVNELAVLPDDFKEV